MKFEEYYSKSLKNQKIASDNLFSYIEIMQKSADKILESTLKQFLWMPNFSQESCLYLSRSCLQATSNIKSLVDSGYEGVEKLLGIQKDKNKQASSAREQADSDTILS